MNNIHANSPAEWDSGPGDVETSGNDFARSAWSYVLGLLLAAGLTGASFWVVHTDVIYGPGVPIALIVLAIAQMGIHLVFFLHMTADPDNTNNALALAFGTLICCLVIFGSMWIMYHLNHNMMPMKERPPRDSVGTTAK
ncbi:MAG: cytochrome o ubiquinol oxidase subunit IV [Pseudomonadota bacterium]|nr:cytochrome o ubiquinol oxidase subunit IV [Pseudomonadota bacterium]